MIGEDEVLLAQGLALIVQRAGFEVAAVAGDAEALVQAAAGHRPRLVIADVRMPPTHTDDGLRAVQRIRATEPATAVLVLTHYVNRQYAIELLEGVTSGVGYLLKQRVAAAESFCEDLRRICQGGSVIDPELISTLLNTRRDDDPIERLTRRQKDVLRLMAEGRSNAAIAAQFLVSEKAVVQHISHLYDRLGLPPSADDHRRVLAVLRYMSGLPS